MLDLEIYGLRGFDLLGTTLALATLALTGLEITGLQVTQETAQDVTDTTSTCSLGIGRTTSDSTASETTKSNVRICEPILSISIGYSEHTPQGAE